MQQSRAISGAYTGPKPRDVELGIGIRKSEPAYSETYTLLFAPGKVSRLRCRPKVSLELTVSFASTSPVDNYFSAAEIAVLRQRSPLGAYSGASAGLEHRLAENSVTRIDDRAYIAHSVGRPATRIVYSDGRGFYSNSMPFRRRGPT
jgi:hypothetical protein